MTEVKERDYISECVAMRDMNAKQIAAIFGIDRNGKCNRLAQRKRRAGIALYQNPELAKSLQGKPLREILIAAEKSIEGKTYAFD